jgi:hypothetical protein
VFSSSFSSSTLTLSPLVLFASTFQPLNCFFILFLSLTIPFLSTIPLFPSAPSHQHQVASPSSNTKKRRFEDMLTLTAALPRVSAMLDLALSAIREDGSARSNPDDLKVITLHPSPFTLHPSLFLRPFA